MDEKLSYIFDEIRFYLERVSNQESQLKDYVDTDELRSLLRRVEEVIDDLALGCTSNEKNV
jgi:hypothetical protein